MKVYTTRFYAVSCLALALGLGAAGLLMHTKTTGGNVPFLGAWLSSGVPVQSWADKQKNPRVEQRKMTPEEARDVMEALDKRQYEQGAAQRWRDYQYQLETFDKSNQDKIDAVAKTDPDKAAAMAEDYKKFRAGIVAYHERELSKPWTPPPVTVPQQQ